MAYDLKITGGTIVDGKLIRRDDKDTVAANDTLPGRLLRHGRAA
jgi:N-acyl-D-amino-acid deacylase